MTEDDIKLKEYLTVECNDNDRFFDCVHGSIYAIPEYNVYQNKCNIQQECCCVGCDKFIPKIVKED